MSSAGWGFVIMSSLAELRLPVRWLMIFLLPVAWVGCGGGGLERQPVKGMIKFGGKPIQYGSIRLEPADKQPTGTSASIRNGEFKIDRSAGVTEGKYMVWVQAFDRSGELPPGAMPGQEGPPPKDILPARYLNSPAGEVAIRKVTDSSPNQLDLDLK